MEKQACVTLQRPPPLTFTLDKSFPVFSTSITFNCGFKRAAVTAQKNPAAPPPATTKVFRIRLFFRLRRWRFLYEMKIPPGTEGFFDLNQKTSAKIFEKSVISILW
jgi:hypothetical protein